MKTVKLSEISCFEVMIPDIPEAISLSNGIRYDIKDYSTEQLQVIGEAWTAELIQTAAACGRSRLQRRVRCRTARADF